jgi:hypothetical protein
MTPSSRTPEGEPNRCPFCNRELRIEHSNPPGDAPCPYCGCLVWFDPASSSDEDRNLIDKKKSLIREKVQRIAALGKHAEIGVEGYFTTFLPEVVFCMAAFAGAIWMRSSETLKLAYCFKRENFGLRDNRFRDRHDTLLQAAFRQGESMIVPPGIDYGQEGGGNPTASLLLLSPIKVKGEIVGIVEIFQRTEAGESTRRGYLRFLQQMCELAGDSFAMRTMEVAQAAGTKKKKPWWKFWQHS